MAVDDVGACNGGGHRQISTQGVEQLGVTRLLRSPRCRRGYAPHGQVCLARVLIAEAEHTYLVRAAFLAAQLAREVFNMHTRSPIDMRGVLIGK